MHLRLLLGSMEKNKHNMLSGLTRESVAALRGELPGCAARLKR